MTEQKGPSVPQPGRVSSRTYTHYRQERCICGLVLIYTPKEKP